MTFASSRWTGARTCPRNVRQWMGSSRGRWEGDTLVVETTNFNDRKAFRGSSENMRLTERFTRVDEDTIRYQFTVDDPGHVDKTLVRGDADEETIGPIFEHACHEGNYGLYNTLAGPGPKRRERPKKPRTKPSK